MTKLITVTALFAAAVCAQATPKKSTKTTTNPAPAAAPSIPKDAVKNADGNWNYTDKQGRKWVYVKTPFGVMKTDVTDAESRPEPPLSANTKVIDKGDSVRFEQPGPFGPIAWEKKKSDLTDRERQLIDSQTQTETQTAKPDTK
jgi:hypothetical protein